VTNTRAPAPALFRPCVFGLWGLLESVAETNRRFQAECQLMFQAECQLMFQADCQLMFQADCQLMACALFCASAAARRG
jgi:hypothetical protein